MAQLLSTTYWWPHLLDSCTQFVHQCFSCQLTKERHTTKHGWGGTLIAPPPGPRLEWSMDVLSNLPACGPHKHILTVVDCYSKFVLVFALPNLTASTISTLFLNHIIAVFGVPQAVRTDNGSEFRGVFAETLASLQVTLKRSKPYHSNANGQSERYHAVIATLICRTLHGLPHTLWATLLPRLQLALNSTYHKALGCAPHLVMYGAPPTPLVPDMRAPPVPVDLDAQLPQYA